MTPNFAGLVRGSDNCACKGCFCDINVTPAFFFEPSISQSLNTYHQTGDRWILVNKFMEEIIFLLRTCCKYILVFSYVYLFLCYLHFSSKALQKRKRKNNYWQLSKLKKKPCLSLMNKFNSLVYVQHFYALNSKKKKKRKKRLVSNYLEDVQTLRNILKY